MKQLSQPIHPDLIDAIKYVYEPNKWKINNLVREKESFEYGATEFILNQHNIKFRVAKTTPKKNGQFVTLWKRAGSGSIQPFDMADSFDLVVISTRSSTHFGQFIFPKNLLHKKGIVSKDEIGGKLAIRVYPPWDIANSKQAIKTQKWQLPYFFEINEGMGLSNIKKLFFNQT